MARLPRFIIPGHPQHVIVRGNNRQEIFCAEADYRFYLEKLEAACDKYQCDVHAYVLMTNHVHLLITPHREDSISKAMQMVGRYYVQYYNYCYRRTGTLWEGRYKATLIDSETYLLSCMRYIEMNPVRAGMVSHPSEYPWSSYGRNALGREDSLVVPHLEYRRLGRGEEQRQSAYRQLFRSRLGESVVNEIRNATNKAWVLGTDRFKGRIQQQLERRVQPSERGGDRKSQRYLDAVIKGV
jgi:putative transposase